MWQAALRSYAAMSAHACCLTLPCACPGPCPAPCPAPYPAPGADFRKDYTRLSFFKQRFPSVPLLALTATATPRVQHDVVSQLGIHKCLMFKSSFNRPNLRCGRGQGPPNKHMAAPKYKCNKAKYSVCLPRPPAPHSPALPPASAATRFARRRRGAWTRLPTSSATSSLSRSSQPTSAPGRCR
jgi:hypothetical protein